jgi:hypothetical protein
MLLDHQDNTSGVLFDFFLFLFQIQSSGLSIKFYFFGAVSRFSLIGCSHRSSVTRIGNA